MGYEMQLARLTKSTTNKFQKLGLFQCIVRELVSSATIERELEQSAAIVDQESVDSYTDMALGQSALHASQLFHAAQISQVITNCRCVIDLACGPAAQLALVAKMNPEIKFIGYDLSAPMLEKAQQLFRREHIENVSLMQGDITDLSEIENTSVDGVISTYAFHHLPDEEALRKCFREIRRVLCPGGALYLFDFLLLRSARSIDWLVDLNRDQPEVFADEYRDSLYAAFPGEVMERVSEDELPGHARFHKPSLFPLMGIVKTKSEALAEKKKHILLEHRNRLDSEYLDVLGFLQLGFRLAGIRTDPFR